MDHARCNMFKNVWDNDCSNVVFHLQVLEAIKNGRWKDKIEELRAERDENQRRHFKNRLPCVTFSGVFTKRLAEGGLAEYPEIVVLDVDKVRKADIPKIKEALKEDNHIAAFFDSPSKGLKILIHVSSSWDQHREYAFPFLEEYMVTNYGIQIDPSGKDLTRLCFISYDPDLYYNESYTIMNIDLKEKSNFRSIKDRTRELAPFHEISNDIKHIFSVCDKMVRRSKVGAYGKGNRNNFIYSLACHLNRAGVSEDDALSMVWNRYSSLDFQEVRATVLSPYKHRRGEFGTKPIWQSKGPQTKLFDQ